MLDIRDMLTSVGIPIAEESFYTAPPLPYLIFLEQTTIRGADSLNRIAERAVTIELYTNKITPDIERDIEFQLNGIPVEYTRDRMWLSSEKMYETIFTFALTEKL